MRSCEVITEVLDFFPICMVAYIIPDPLVVKGQGFHLFTDTPDGAQYEDEFASRDDAVEEAQRLARLYEETGE